jgi:hypothetical protein
MLKDSVRRESLLSAVKVDSFSVSEIRLSLSSSATLGIIGFIGGKILLGSELTGGRVKESLRFLVSDISLELFTLLQFATLK